MAPCWLLTPMLAPWLLTAVNPRWLVPMAPRWLPTSVAPRWLLTTMTQARLRVLESMAPRRTLLWPLAPLLSLSPVLQAHRPPGAGSLLLMMMTTTTGLRADLVRSGPVWAHPVLPISAGPAMRQRPI